MAESVSVDVLAKVYGTQDVSKLGDQFAKTAVTADAAAASLKVWNDTAAKSAKADATLVQSRNAHAKADKLVADAYNVLNGNATQYTRLLADQRQKEDDAAKSAEGLAARFSALAGSGSIAGGGMGALIGAGVVLSPIIATLGAGLAGFGLAAYGVAKPIEKAAQATGGLSANLKTLTPEQQKVAQGLLGLGADFAAFQKRMQPEVFGVFNQGLSLAQTLLHGIEPVAAATGKALGVLIGQVDAEFRSGTWQNFFTFMAQNAGPDMALLGKNITDLLQVIPPLTEDLQPLARSILVVSDDAAKAAGGIVSFYNAFQRDVPVSNQHTLGFFQDLDKWTVQLTNHLGPWARAINNAGTDAQHSLTGAGTAGAAAAKGIGGAGDAALTSGPKFFSLDKQVRILNTDMTKMVGNLLTLQGSQLSWKQSLQAAETQLKSNSAGLEGNSKNALANRLAVLQSTQAALGFAGEQLQLGKNIGGASKTVQAQINWLQGLHDKSKFVMDEIHALRLEEQKLEAEKLDQTIHVQGLGQWSVSQSLAPGAGHRRAAGGMIPGAGNSDSYPALLTPGEVVVPKGMVRSGAVDHLRGRLPGFAAGGIVPNYGGTVGGIWPWLQGNDSATIRLIDLAVVKATVAGIRAAQSAASAAGAPGSLGGPASAGAAQAQAYARSRLGAYGWGSDQMSPLIALWNQESGWNRFARNPSSGAYGIPQALPPGKMGAAANPPLSSAAAQINWGLGYIASRYGSPSAAEGHELAFHWYDNPRGTVMPPGLSLAYNGTGRPEMLVPNRGGTTQHVVWEIRGGSGEFDQFMAKWIKRHVRIAGGGDVQKAFTTTR